MRDKLPPLPEFVTTADTTLTTKIATVPLSAGVASLFGIPLSDLTAYVSILIGCMVIVDYLWKWYRRYQTPVVVYHASTAVVDLDDDKDD